MAQHEERVVAATGIRLVAVDVLRAVAALLVLMNHTSVDFAHAARWTHPLGWVFVVGGTGVSLFLVISGYTIAGRWSGRADPDGHFPVRAFWTRRFFRLYPTFWLAALLSLALLVAADGFGPVRHRPRPWVFFDGQIPFVVQVLGYATVVTANVFPLAHMGRAWSLALEEQLYALFTLIQRFWPDRVRPVRLLAWGIVADLGYRTLLLVAQPGWGAPSSRPVSTKELFLFFQVPALMVAWLAGWVLSEAKRGHVRVPAVFRSYTAGVGLFAAGVLLHHWGGPVLELGGGRILAPVDMVLDLIFVAAFAALLGASVLGTPRDTRPVGAARAGQLLAWIGLWSYSLYLLHPPVLELVDRRSGLPTLLRVPLGWSLSLLVSWLFWLLVERRWVARASAVGRPERHQKPYDDSRRQREGHGLGRAEPG